MPGIPEGYQTGTPTGYKLKTKEGTMAQVKVHPGICGFPAHITATADEDLQVDVQIHSDCPAIQAMEVDLKGLDAYAEVLSGWGTSTVNKSAAQHCHHAACPVPAGILKAIEVAAQLALPQDVVMQVTKE